MCVCVVVTFKFVSEIDYGELLNLRLRLCLMSVVFYSISLYASLCSAMFCVCVAFHKVHHVETLTVMLAS